jgi:uncharacterized protein YdcH (DUF465 family)
MANTLKKYKYLESLKAEHHALDLQINRIAKSKIINPFELQTLKKQRLYIKELIFKQQFKITLPTNDNLTSLQSVKDN